MARIEIDQVICFLLLKEGPVVVFMLCAVCRKSTGCEITWGLRFSAVEAMQTFLRDLAQEVSRRLESSSLIGSVLAVKIMKKKPDAGEPQKYLGHGACDHFSRSKTLPRPTGSADTIYQEALAIILGLAIPVDQIRGIGIHVQKLVKKDPVGKDVPSCRSVSLEQASLTQTVRKSIGHRMQKRAAQSDVWREKHDFYAREAELSAKKSLLHGKSKTMHTKGHCATLTRTLFQFWHGKPSSPPSPPPPLVKREPSVAPCPFVPPSCRSRLDLDILRHEIDAWLSSPESDTARAETLKQSIQSLCQGARLDCLRGMILYLKLKRDRGDAHRAHAVDDLLQHAHVLFATHYPGKSLLHV